MVEQSSFNKLVGATLGNYRLQQLIGRDSTGPVFLARSTNSNALVSLRLLLPPVEIAPEERVVYLGRFQQEANQVAALRHAHIIPLEDYGNYQGMPYLVWPYNSASQQLHSYITRYGPLDALTASRYLDQIAEALEYAHQRAVLHRNLTTHSIYMETGAPPHQARLVVTEFGVLRMLELACQGQQNVANLLNAGSEGCAPEQLQGKAADPATDSYALGAVLYRLLTGQRAFTGETRDAVVQRILHDPVPPLSKSRSDLPAGLDEIIARAMAKDPANRYRRPIDLAEAYHALAAPQDRARPALVAAAPIPAPILRTAPVAAKKAPAVSRRRVLYYIVAGGAAAAAITTVAIVGPRLLSGNSSSSTASSSGAPATGSGVTTTPGSGSSATPTKQGHTGTVIAQVSAVPANSAKTFAIANQTNPGILIHLAGGSTFVAFNSTCTHAGCAVNYNPGDKLLECPCHGAAFDPAKNAAVVQGPAQTPLAPIAITVNSDGTITTNN
jgi:eukaryotic-like serine/threonine-protein kinase